MLRRWLIMGFGVTSLAVALAGVYAWAVRPESYHDAVGEALDQRQIAYTRLEVREMTTHNPSLLFPRQVSQDADIVRAKLSIKMDFCCGHGPLK